MTKKNQIIFYMALVLTVDFCAIISNFNCFSQAAGMAS